MARYRVDIKIESDELTRRDRVTAYNAKHVERIRLQVRELAPLGSTVTITQREI